MNVLERFFAKQGLNEAQRQAVETTEGFIRLTAGAGSGKTRALATRYVYLTDMLGVDPDNILCITFTRKAAEEMKNRIASSSTLQAEGSRISTYHGFCHSVIKEDGHRMHLKKEFNVLGESEQEKLLRKIYREQLLTIKDGEMKKINHVFGYYKSRRDYVRFFDGMHSRTFDDNVSLFSDHLLPVLKDPKLVLTAEEINRFCAILSHYLAHQVRDSSFDFMDLMYFTLYLFSHDEHVLHKWQDRLQYIMVDEYQDSSRIEEELIKYISKLHQNLFVVGDPDQAIYSFKGGDIDVFLDFGKTFDMSHDLLLTENYRSTSNIVNLSNELVQKNLNRIDKVSTPTRVEGSKPIHFHCKKDDQEMDYIVDKIKGVIDSKKYSYKDIAVILRTHRSKKPIEQAFVKAGYPYTIADGLKFYAKSEIKIAIAYIRMLLESDNDSFALTVNVPSRRVGEVLNQRIEQTADTNLCGFYEALKILQSNSDPIFLRTQSDEYIDAIEFMRSRVGKESLSTLVSDILRMSGYLRYLREGANQAKIDNVEDLIESVRLLEERRQQEVSLEEYIQIIDEFTREAEEDEEKNEIQIMTMHSSKGLEFKVVFLPLFNDGNIPSSKSTSDPRKLEEERRLAYVAFTRAEDILIISDSEGQSERGSNRSPSRFLFDFSRDQLDEPIPISDKQVLQYQEMYNREQRLQYINETDEIKVGDQVEHPVFGIGMIKAVDSKNYLVSFEKLATDRTIGKHVPIKALGKQSINILKTTDNNSDLRTISVGTEDDSFTDTITCSIGNENQGVEAQEESTLMDTVIVSTINVYEKKVRQEVDPLDDYIDSAYCSPQIDERVIDTSVEVIATNKESESVSIAQLIGEPETVAKVAVEHPIWGKGFITESHESHIAIRFPEINEVKLLPNNIISIRRL